ncbi:hypothetical protein RclHR1_15110001 [Rhizophagus clarus]|uniref:Uncharacterized protein n=1 Tax=Rhizophagus clarus TaxID=94130 RepID=A0A2Z6R767_9GLOM|nr:hypothetical protein RclHR1_15110001 [Rhizophagus clarus]GES99189.1 hypothetical protein GLOIN_2v1497169 [Rhizophagus clarus]
MDVLGTPVGKRKFVKEIIQDIPRILQIQRTNLSTTEWKSTLFDDNFRWNEYCTKHNLRWPLPVLCDQYQTNSKNIEVSRGTDKFSFSTSETISEMGSILGNRISLNSMCNQCDVEVQVVQDSANRPHLIQTSLSGTSIELQPSAPTSPPIRLGRLKLQLERQATLRKLSRDLEAQYSHEVPSLLNILKSFYPFNETSGNVLEDYEINDFFELYDISNVRPILASNDNYVFWLEDTAGAIYMWSRVDSTMSYLGRELREALVNYLFHQDNICYVVEFTHEIMPKNEIEQKARELADSCEPVDIDELVVTKESPNPVKRNEKKKRKKKGKKKRKNKGKKKTNKH